jgi:hypothetical protein
VSRSGLVVCEDCSNRVAMQRTTFLPGKPLLPEIPSEQPPDCDSITAPVSREIRRPSSLPPKSWPECCKSVHDGKADDSVAHLVTDATRNLARTV